MNPLILKLERLDGVSDDEKAALEAVLSPPRKVGQGECFIQELERPKHSTLLLAGLAGRYNLLPDGGRQITALHVAGDFVDLHSFLLHTMDHGIVALTHCIIATAPHPSLRTITERFPHLTRLLWLSTLLDAAIHRRWLVTMGRLSAPQQLAHLLCELWARLEVVGLTRGDEFDFAITQLELSDALGLSPVHVNRVIQNLRRNDLISWKGEVLTINNMVQLRKFAEFDPDYLHQRVEPR